MRSILKLSLVCFAASLLVVSACKKKKTDPADTSTTPTNTSFDNKAMLGNFANNIIVPSFQALNLAVARLDSSIAAFTATTTASTLANAQTAFKNAYLAWQSCSELQFGPADQQYLRENLNTFPADTNQVNLNVTANVYNLSALINFPAKGFPALDYLLFGTGSNNASILLQYTSSSKTANRKQYLAALSADIKTNTTAVLNAWSGTYIATFINAAGTDIGSSIGQLINALDFDLDVLKNDKLGVPLGKQSMGTLYPGKVEGYYSGISAQLLTAQIKAFQNIYLGKGTQGNGLGFDDYLASISAQYNGGSLNDAITGRFTAVLTDLGSVPDPLSSDILTNPATANTAYTDVQKLLVLLKTDMPSSMGVLITYEDTDGD